jgi:hypothetical protein
MMAFTNLIGLVGLAGLAIASVRSYVKKLDRYQSSSRQEEPIFY